MLQIKISRAEIQQLNYERFYYPCPIVQKRIHAVFLKTVTNMPSQLIGQMSGLYRHSVNKWFNTYQNDGFESLLRVNYGTNK